MTVLNDPRVVEPKIRSAYNNTGSTILKGTVVKLNSSAPVFAGEVAKATAVSDVLYGVTLSDLPTAQWGDVAVAGIVPVLASAALGQGVKVTVEAAGRLAAWSSGNALVGTTVSASNAANDLQEVELAGAGGNAT
jgi:hypothetical protein